MQCLCVLLLVTICHVRTSATQGSLKKPDLSLDVKSLTINGRLTAHCATNVTPGRVTCSLYVGNTSVTSETTTGETCDFEVSRSQLDGDPVTFKIVKLSCDYQTNGGTGDQRSPRSDPKELLLLVPLQKATLQVTSTSITLEEKIQISCEVNKNHTGVKCQLYDNETKLEDGQCRWTMTGRQLMTGTGPGMVLLTCDYTLDVWQKQPDIKDQFDTRSNRVTVTVTDPGPSQTTQTDFTSAGTSTGNEPQDQESNKTSSLPLYLGTGFAVLAFFILVGTMLICNRRKQKSKRSSSMVSTTYFDVPAVAKRPTGEIQTVCKYGPRPLEDTSDVLNLCFKAFKLLCHYVVRGRVRRVLWGREGKREKWPPCSQVSVGNNIIIRLDEENTQSMGQE